MSKLLPNTFQHHNFYVDHLSYFLTSDEEKVLNRAIREILGWQDRIEGRSANIALSIFVNGRFRKGQPKTEESRLSYGCGLSLPTVRKCLAALDEFGILVKVDRATNDGQLYTLQIDSDKINWQALEKRRQEWDAKNQERTKAATLATLEKQGDNVPRKGLRVTEGVTSDDTPGVTSDDTPGVTSDDTQKSQSKTNLKPKHGEATASRPPGLKSLLKERFLQVTKLPEPTSKPDVSFWWSRFAELARIFQSYDDQAALAGMERVIRDMERQGLTVAGPESIVKMCRQYVAQKARKVSTSVSRNDTPEFRARYEQIKAVDKPLMEGY